MSFNEIFGCFHRGGAETGGRVDFNQPRLQIAVYDDVVPVALKIGDRVKTGKS